MHLCLAGLLHFVRNDGKGVMNYGSINNCAATNDASFFCFGIRITPEFAALTLLAVRSTLNQAGTLV